MSSLKSKDRVSLCSFTFSDGRHCRTPRLRDNPRFCPYHAQKEARARAAQKLGKDLAYFFSGDYLSACDLTTALGRLIPAVIRGEVKPRAARTVAYLAQTLLQAIHLSKHEYTNAFGSDGWRQSIRNSVRGNYDYRFPPAPKPEHSGQPQPQPASLQPQPQPQPAEPPVNCHSVAVAQAFRPEESASSSNSSLATHHSPLPQTPAPSPHTPLPPTSAEFVQRVVAGRNLSQPGGETSAAQVPQPSQTPPSQPVETPANCHPACPDLVGERNEGSASSSSPLATHHSPLPQSPTPTPRPSNPPLTAPPTQPRVPNRDAPWLNWGDQSHIPPDSHLL
jgi:hypothetical protein